MIEILRNIHYKISLKKNKKSYFLKEGKENNVCLHR
jgi:hypothetical protein